MTFFVYVVTYLCIIATFFNDGFTMMFFSIPFILFILIDITVSKNKSILFFNGISILILFILALTRFSNPLIYPVLNKKLVTTKDYNLTHFPYDTQTLVETKNIDSRLFKNKEQLEYYKKMDLYKEYTLKKGTLITPVKVIISGHPDVLGISYQLEIEINDNRLENKVKKYILLHNKDIGLDINTKVPIHIKDKYIQFYRNSVLNSNDNIYAGGWFFENFPKKNTFEKSIESIVEKYFGSIVMMFNPMLIWIYIIIFILQFYYIRKKIINKNN